MAATLKDIFGKILGKKGEAIRELDVSMRAQVRKRRAAAAAALLFFVLQFEGFLIKGNLTERQDTMLRACSIFTNMSYFLVSSSVGLATSFTTGQVHKIVGGQRVPRLIRLGVSAGAGLIAGQMMYYSTLNTCTSYILNNGDERLKTELATIILTKHSDERSSVEAVRKHFYAEQLYSDQHQDKLCFRWIPRNLYVDSTYMERLKEIEANNSADKAKTVSTNAMIKNRSFGDLMEDPLACILGSTDCDMENQDDNPPKRTATILKRRDSRARRRRHRHHHHHATL